MSKEVLGKCCTKWEDEDVLLKMVVNDVTVGEVDKVFDEEDDMRGLDSLASQLLVDNVNLMQVHIHNLNFRVDPTLEREPGGVCGLPSALRCVGGSLSGPGTDRGADSLIGGECGLTNGSKLDSVAVEHVMI